MGTPSLDSQCKYRFGQRYNGIRQRALKITQIRSNKLIAFVIFLLYHKSLELILDNKELH